MQCFVLAQILLNVGWHEKMQEGGRGAVVGSIALRVVLEPDQLMINDGLCSAAALSLIPFSCPLPSVAWAMPLAFDSFSRPRPL